MIYIDITELLEYLKHNAQVVGIPRVTIEILRGLVEAGKAESYRLIAFHPDRRRLLATDLQSAYADLSEPTTLIAYFRVSPWIIRMKALASLSSPRDIFSVMAMGSNTKSRARAAWSKPKFSDGDAIVFPAYIFRRPKVVSAFKELKSRHDLKFIQFIHDLIPIAKKEFMPPSDSQWFREGLEAFSRLTHAVICVSEATKRDYLDWSAGQARAPKDAVVVPLAHEFSTAGNARTDAAVRSETWADVSAETLRAARRPYALCVGTREIRKNNFGLARAWEKLLAERGPGLPRLIFVGGKGWMNREFDGFIARTNSLNGYIQVLQEVTDLDLAYLYKNCQFSIFPSFYEGWGLPIGEGLWFGKPVIASNLSSMPEVGGRYVDYVDPSDLPSMCEAIGRMLDSEYRAAREAEIATMPKRRWLDVAIDLDAALTSAS